MSPRIHLRETYAGAEIDVWVGPHDFGPESHKDTVVGQIRVAWPKRSLETRFWGREVSEAVSLARRVAETGGWS